MANTSCRLSRRRPWLASARRLGGSATDCTHTQVAGDIGDCANFMEWNARSQLTTWYPVLGSASAPRVQQGGRDHDYARKQWSGLLRDVYLPRAELFLGQALRDAVAGTPFDGAAPHPQAFGRQPPHQSPGPSAGRPSPARHIYVRFIIWIDLHMVESN